MPICTPPWGPSSPALPQDMLPVSCKIYIRPGSTLVCGVTMLPHVTNHVCCQQGHNRVVKSPAVNIKTPDWPHRLRPSESRAPVRALGTIKSPACLLLTCLSHIAPQLYHPTLVATTWQDEGKSSSSQSLLTTFANDVATVPPNLQCVRHLWLRRSWWYPLRFRYLVDVRRPRHPRLQELFWQPQRDSPRWYYSVDACGFSRGCAVFLISGRSPFA
jgi:hypothetical protein